MRILILIALAFVVLPISSHYFLKETITIEVTDKERVQQNNGDSKYLIFSRNEVFENTDTILSFKFNSSDVYAAMAAGDTCIVRVTGLRIPILSSYRNILAVESCEQ
jgi:hypothetical protein